MEAATHPFNQNFNAVPGGDEASDQSFQALERASGDLNVLSRFQRLIDLQTFTKAGADSDFADQCIRQKRKTISESYEAANPWALADSPIAGCIIKSSKKVTGKHRLDEPDRPSRCRFPETQSRTEDLDFRDLAQASSGDMLPFGLAPQAEPSSA